MEIWIKASEIIKAVLFSTLGGQEVKAEFKFQL